MNKIDVQFYVRFPNEKFDPIDFSDIYPEFKNIRLEAMSEKIGGHKIVVQKQVPHFHPAALRPVVEEAIKEAQLFIYCFAAASDLKFYEFNCLGYAAGGNFHKLASLDQNSGGLRLSAQMVVTRGKPTIQKIKALLNQPQDVAKLRSFFSIACLEDSVSRYLSLYTALLHNFDDAQSKVDAAILNIDATVQQTRRPDRPKLFETIFTRLRNEMSHKRPNCSVLQTIEEITLHVDRLESLARRILLG